MPLFPRVPPGSHRLFLRRSTKRKPPPANGATIYENLRSRSAYRVQRRCYPLLTLNLFLFLFSSYSLPPQFTQTQPIHNLFLTPVPNLSQHLKTHLNIKKMQVHAL
ncbi:hypothetical protein EJ06DRAFT_69203 [Trichodelitschia bisporula]|uniref:Uncharacterized protein n=1 Tax=Trichodelitschia bisporula TaxID=703511 RepID=A0A6G1HTA9_9PEZI|nr:hypothetical protein EJ06DRAFT_69203 [Trichodelitschia bisporula]